MRQLFTGFARREQGTFVFSSCLVAAAFAVLAWPWLSGSVTIPWDAKAHFLPQVQFLAQSLGSAENPFWTPYVFSGHPQVADPQSLIFSPPFLLLALIDRFPSPWAADVTLYILLLLSMLAMLRWLFDRGWHPAAGLLSALSFGFGAAMAWRVQHLGQVMSLAYLPVILLCLDRALARRSLVWGAGAGLATACLILGRDQVGLLALYFLAAYVPCQLWCSDNALAAARAAVPALATAALVSLALVAMPILLTLLTAAQSNRPSIDFVGAGRGSLHPASLLTIFSADVYDASGHRGEFWGPPSGRWSGLDLFLAQNMGVAYTGALTAFLVVRGGILGLLWRRDIRIFTLGLILTCIYAVGWYTPIFRLMHAYLPGVALYRRPADAVFNIGFFLSVLGGYSLNALLGPDAPRPGPGARLAVAAIPTAAFAILLALAHHFDMLKTAAPVIAISVLLWVGAALLTLALPRMRHAGLAAAVVALFMTGDLAWSNGPNGATALPPAEFDVLTEGTRDDTLAVLKQRTQRTATRRDRVEIVGFGFHWPNVSLTHGLENTLGYNPVRNALYVAATGAGDHAGLPEQKKFSKLSPSYRSLLADLLGLRFIATSVPIEQIDTSLKPGDIALIAKTAQGYVYENPRALPRAMFVRAAMKADFNAIVTSGAWPPHFDPLSAVLLEQVPETDKAVHGTGAISIDAYHHTRVELTVDSEEGGYAVLNDMWHPWWFARLDGIDVPIERANVLFRAVAVSPGRHKIVMEFQPVRGAWRQLTQRRP